MKNFEDTNSNNTKNMLPKKAIKYSVTILIALALIASTSATTLYITKSKKSNNSDAVMALNTENIDNIVENIKNEEKIEEIPEVVKQKIIEVAKEDTSVKEIPKTKPVVNEVVPKTEIKVNDPKPKENENNSTENKIKDPYEDFKTYLIDFEKELLAPYRSANTDLHELGFLTITSFESNQKINVILNNLKTRKKLLIDSPILSIKYVNGVLDRIDSYNLSEADEDKFLSYYRDTDNENHGNFSEKYLAEYKEFIDRSIELYAYMLNHPDDFSVKTNEKTQEKEIWFSTAISLDAYDSAIYGLIDLDRAISKEYSDLNKYININTNDIEA